MSSLVGNAMGMGNVALAKKFSCEIMIYCYLIFAFIIVLLYL